MEKQNKTNIIKKYLESRGIGDVSTSEMIVFKKSCTAGEWVQFAIDSAKALGIPLENVDALLASFATLDEEI